MLTRNGTAGSIHDEIIRLFFQRFYRVPPAVFSVLVLIQNSAFSVRPLEFWGIQAQLCYIRGLLFCGNVEHGRFADHDRARLAVRDFLH